jgi:hypothetical protein
VNVCVLNTTLGSNQNLFVDYDKNEFKWIDDIPINTWVYGDINARLSVDVLFKLLNKQSNFIPENYRNSLLELKLNSTEMNMVRWQYVMPPKIYMKFVRNVLDAIYDCFNDSMVDYYKNVYVKAHDLLGSLDRAAIDTDLYHTFLSSERNDTNYSTIKTFQPGCDGFAEPIKYNQLSSRTGRLTVLSGPRILTLKKNMKKMITSRYKHGKIVSLDYVSLEPRIARGIHSEIVKPDIYEDLIASALHGVTRKTAKLIVLPYLYGAAPKTIATRLNIPLSLIKNYCVALDSYFMIGDIVKKLHSELLKHGFIYNYYGRSLKPDTTSSNVLYNHYIQSTGVDVAMLGFNAITDYIMKNNLKIHPIFIIHDCLILDVHPEMEYELNNLMKIGEHINGFDIKFAMDKELI